MFSPFFLNSSSFRSNFNVVRCAKTCKNTAKIAPTPTSPKNNFIHPDKSHSGLRSHKPHPSLTAPNAVWIGNVIVTNNVKKRTDQKSVIYSKIKGEEDRMVRIIQNARNTIVYSSDTLDPTLVNQLDGLCTFVGQLGISEKDGMLEFAKYEKSRRKIDVVTKKLASITESSPVFK